MPILFGLWSVIARNKLVNRIALIGSAVLYVVIAAAQWMNIEWYVLPTWFLTYFQFDTIGLYFFSIMTLVFGSAAVYSLFYFKIHALSAKQEAVYIIEILFFIVSMSGVILSTHLASLWVFIEASTLTSAMLIYFEKKKSSLEAAWKYIFICSIGIALAFVGIIVLSIGSRHIDSLFFKDLYARASEINPFWLKVSFAFIFVGLGTKIGVAPIHAWLPDAHSEAPSPVSALLSGALLNSALLGLLRVQEIFIHARLDDFSNFLFLITGFLSLMVSAVFMLRLKNYKRMLAYSSIENMGILFIGIALGKYGIFAALLHTLAHSLSKASLFLTSGNILQLYKSKRIEEVNGLLQTDPRTGWLWIISMLAIIGFPPFPVFISKFLIVRAFWLSGMSWLAIPFFLFLVIIMFGMGGTVFKMAFSDVQTANAGSKKFAAYAYAPQLVLLLILCIIGINMPKQVLDLLNGAVGFFQ
ncbi:MAG: proton-conducting transporter membrane subunit [Ignavibacteriales bacterium]|nr:proton-conducting transporter membrane subunit [Ignavibacteriales bacterium]